MIGIRHFGLVEYKDTISSDWSLIFEFYGMAVSKGNRKLDAADRFDKM